MADRCIIPADTPIGAHFRRAVGEKKVILVAGLPSSGKSLMLQQLTILADQAGRPIHTMQWDTARRPFETERWLDRYPERDDVTHPGIRKAVGFWVRGAVADWTARHRDDTAILIGELPVVGGGGLLSCCSPSMTWRSRYWLAAMCRSLCRSRRRRCGAS